MDPDYLELVRLVIAFVSAASIGGGLFFTVRKMYKDYLNRHDQRVLLIERNEAGHVSVQAKGLTVREMSEVAKQYAVNEIKD